MTKVAIHSEQTATGSLSFRAVAGDKQSTGRTAGEALDGIVSQLPQDDGGGTLVIVQRFQPDRFFTAAQQQRLGELMDRWRAARDTGNSLPAAEQAELEALVEAELRASADRADAMLRELRP